MTDWKIDFCDQTCLEKRGFVRDNQVAKDNTPPDFLFWFGPLSHWYLGQIVSVHASLGFTIYKKRIRLAWRRKNVRFSLNKNGCLFKCTRFNRFSGFCFVRRNQTVRSPLRVLLCRVRGSMFVYSFLSARSAWWVIGGRNQWKNVRCPQNHPLTVYDVQIVYTRRSVPAGSPSRGGDVTVYVLHINQPSLPTLFLLFLCLFLSLWPFQLYFIPKFLPTTLCFLTLFFRSYFCLKGSFNYISLSESLIRPWYNPLWLTGLNAPTNH